MGSNRNTIYHLLGKPNTFEHELKSVELVKISEEEYGRLSTEFAISKQENESIRNEMAVLKQQLDEQNYLLEKILAKLS